MTTASLLRRIEGSLLGMAVGDALGLPFENLPSPRVRRLCGDLSRFHLVFGWGMISDDTEHALMTAQALTVSGGDLERFRRSLSWRLRLWLLGIPAAVGRATLLSILRLWVGIPPTRSGVRSAGNGPAMRAPILGCVLGEDPARLWEFVDASSRMTHSDPRALLGTRAIALASAISSSGEAVAPGSYLSKVKCDLTEPEGADLVALLQTVAESVQRGEATPEFCAAMGWERGVSGFINQTVPAAVHAWLSHPEDWKAAVSAVIHSGGDTDTTAAIVGGIVGARVTADGIPCELLERLWEWPRSVRWMRRVARSLAESVESGAPGRAVPLNPVGALLRNIVFLAVVVFHLLTRWAGFARR